GRSRRGVCGVLLRASEKSCAPPGREHSDRFHAPERALDLLREFLPARRELLSFCTGPTGSAREQAAVGRKPQRILEQHLGDRFGARDSPLQLVLLAEREALR